MQEISVITIYNLKEPYSYLAPKALQLTQGEIVLVTLRNKKTFGIVVKNYTNKYKKKLKTIISKVDNVSILPQLVDFIMWSAEYNIINLGAFLKMVWPFPDLILSNAVGCNTIHYTYSYNEEKVNLYDINTLTSKQRDILLFIKKFTNIRQDIINEHNLSKSIINKLLNLELINKKKFFLPIQNNKQKNINTSLLLTLNDIQEECYQKLMTIIKKREFNVTLLDGVPGSGKTEVYFKIMAEVLKQNKMVLVLIPEIALSVQWLSRFKEKFGVEAFVWHSNISKKEKQSTFLAILNQEVKVIVGTRSALFLPFKNLGLIIIDEEHDSSFKQEEKIIYNARDLAITRAYFHNIPVILTTATPALETWHNVQTGKYNYLQLKTRFNKSSLPVIELADNYYCKINKEYISNLLLTKLVANYKKGEQSLLFLNKRGYANIVVCEDCNNKIICPKCSYDNEIVSLVEHKYSKQYICHRCGYWQYSTKKCPTCGAEKGLIAHGYGIEKIAEEIHQKIPEAKVALASSDIINNASKAAKLVQEIINQNVDIIIGTQILAKGYHFPNLSLVGIIDVGLDTYNIDLKTNEKIWQLLYQVAGRAGREKTKGEVIIQCNNKGFLIETLVDFKRDEFLAQELKERKLANMPPFGRLASIIISSTRLNKLEEYIDSLKRTIFKLPKEYQDCIKGPVKALFFKVNKRFRYRILIHTHKKFKIQNIINTFLAHIAQPSYIYIKIDIDPISFY